MKPRSERSFFVFFAIFSTSSYSFHERVLKRRRYFHLDNMQRSHAAQFRIFCLQGQILSIKGLTLKYCFDSLNDPPFCSHLGHRYVWKRSISHIDLKVTGSKRRSQRSFTFLHVRSKYRVVHCFVYKV